MKFFSNIHSDLLRFSNNGGALRNLKIVLVSHSFHLVALYRIGVFASKLPLGGELIRVFFEYLIRIVYASDISLRSKIGPGLVIMHGHDIVIGSAVVIGENCKILNGVTLGNKDTESSVNQQPIVGDNVVIGSGAKILGSIVVGDGAKIGANSVIIKDVPSGATVVGVPGRLISIDGSAR
ncbi:serine O-acetyltransferase [Pseudomonas sp. SK2]|uniref:serine O-acetyltransferase n=1 Tax=Pseudomonas sp. SK2 TaxID=2841063 RepID=UPI00192B5926|nr:serine O-acetyltransferase [Pseudomonas sp. SK2]QQZ37593.1 serine acetyltransferase [Pseudomonas sp. SK2]